MYIYTYIYIYIYTPEKTINKYTHTYIYTHPCMALMRIPLSCWP